MWDAWQHCKMMLIIIILYVAIHLEIKISSARVMTTSQCSRTSRLAGHSLAKRGLSDDGKVSYIALNKSRRRPSQPTGEVDRLSIFLERFASEKGPAITSQIQANLSRVCDVMNDVLHMVFVTDARFVKVFEMPPLDLDDDKALIQMVAPDVFDCRMFLKPFDHPNSCQVSTSPCPSRITSCIPSSLVTYPHRRGLRFVFDLASQFFLSFFLDLFAHFVE